jgi:hypothetical protein
MCIFKVEINNLKCLSSLSNNRLLKSKSNTTGATCGAGTTWPSGASELTACFSGVNGARSLIFCVYIYFIIQKLPLYNGGPCIYNFVLIKNDTIVSVIICYDFYHNDFDIFFVL